MSLTVGILKKAIELTEKSSMDTYRHGCIIFKGKKILAMGWNAKRSTKNFPSKFKHVPHTIHAEQFAIMQIKNKKILDGASLLNIRVQRNSLELKNARPCDFCMRSILYFKIKHLYYSTATGEIIHQKL